MRIKSTVQIIDLAYKFFLSRYFRHTNIMNISWFVTWRCNALCVFCNLGNKHDDNFSELNTSQAISLIDDLHDAGIKRVSLVGGEPLIREDLPELITAIKKRKLNVSLVTNGLLTRKDVIESRPNEINISLDFPDNRHDKVRNVNNAFVQVCRALDFYASHMDQFGYNLGLNTVLTKENLDSLGNIMELAKQYKVSKVTIQPILKPQVRSIEKTKRLLFNEDDNVKELADKLTLIKQKYKDLFTTSNLFLKEIPMYLTSGNHNLFCFAGGTFINISPTGEILPCIFMDSAGNIQQKRFKEIISSEEFNRLHERAIKNECPHCLCPDIHEPNLIFSPLHWLEALYKANKLK